jgi:hypothetical protein
MTGEMRRQFLEEYSGIRRAEGRGSDDSAYFCALPYQDLTGKNAGQWAIRARTWRHFERFVLPEIDGLSATRHYLRPFPCVEAEFDRLPFLDNSFDLAIYNSPIHYSADYRRTLTEARRCLRRSGAS